MPTKYAVPYGLNVSVSIHREGDTEWVDVHAPLYMRKVWRMPHCYHAQHFTDAQILKEPNFITTMLKHYQN